MKNTIVIKTLFGLENILSEEARSMGAENIIIGKRSVICTADYRTLYSLNLHSRYSIRILKLIKSQKITSDKELYQFIKNIEWENLFNKHYTFAIDSTVHSPYFNHANYVALKSKDAIVDRLRDKWKFRPDVDKLNPDILIHIHISNDECDVLIDSTGNSLHKRGWRIAQNDAPLNEILAAAMIKMSGWNTNHTLIDGMCGSATILMEAASMATNTPPGLKRNFLFQKWKDYDEDLFNKILNEAKNSINRDIKLDIRGIEISQKFYLISKKNINNAGFDNYIKLIKGDFFKLNLDVKDAIILLNPPYGERLEIDEELNSFYKDIGGKLKYDYSGNTAWLLSSNLNAIKFVGLKPTQKYILYNGSLECRFLKYELFDGKLKDKQLS